MKTASLALLLLAACSLDETDFRGRYAVALCEGAQACDPDAFLQEWGDPEDCRLTAEATLSLMPRNGCEMMEDRFRDCLDAVDAASCDALTGPYDGIAPCKAAFACPDAYWVQGREPG